MDWLRTLKKFQKKIIYPWWWPSGWINFWGCPKWWPIGLWNICKNFVFMFTMLLNIFTKKSHYQYFNQVTKNFTFHYDKMPPNGLMCPAFPCPCRKKASLVLMHTASITQKLKSTHNFISLILQYQPTSYLFRILNWTDRVSSALCVYNNF